MLVLSFLSGFEEVFAILSMFFFQSGGLPGGVGGISLSESEISMSEPAVGE